MKSIIHKHNACFDDTQIDEYKRKLKSHKKDERLGAYRFLGFTEDAIFDSDVSIRIEAYRKLGFDERALTDEDFLVRLMGYGELGFNNDALKDLSGAVRIEAYKSLGYTPEALDDESSVVRLMAYRKLGFDKKALDDENIMIQDETSECFKECKEILGLSKIKYDFTETEKDLLRMNGIPLLEDSV